MKQQVGRVLPMAQLQLNTRTASLHNSTPFSSFYGRSFAKKSIKNTKTSTKKISKKELTKTEIDDMKEKNARLTVNFLSHRNIKREGEIYRNIGTDMQQKSKTKRPHTPENVVDSEDESEEESYSEGQGSQGKNR